MPEHSRNSGYLALYLALTHYAAPLVRLHVRRRLRRGKEDPERYREKFGSPSLARPNGALAWMHGVGVGELLALTSLARAMRDEFPGLEILFTSTSRSSAEAIAGNLPEGSRHQFLPMDCPEFVRSFLEHWNPDISVLSERDIWPRLTIETAARDIPLALVNGRMNRASFKSKSKVRSVYSDLYRMFDVIETQNEETARRFALLGAPEQRIRVAGSLKSGGMPLGDFPKARRRLAELLSNRRIWVAASTHEDDEAVVAGAHRKILEERPDAFLAIVPRNVSRSREIARNLENRSISCQILVDGAVPEAIPAQACVVDAYGQLGIWYRLAACAFIGGSTAKIGGHNPYEAARLDCAIFHGPSVENFSSDYRSFHEYKAAKLIRDENELVEAVLGTDHGDLADRAKSVAGRGDDALRKTAERLVRLLAGRPAGHASATGETKEGL